MGRREKLQTKDDREIPTLLDVARLRAIAEANTRPDVTMEAVGNVAVEAWRAYNEGKVRANASSSAELLQSEQDRARFLRTTSGEAVYASGINAYSMMLQLNSQIRGPIKTGPSQPGLLPRLLEQGVPYNTTGLNTGTTIDGWLLAEQGPAHQTARGGVQVPASSRIGLLLQPTGRLLEFRLSDYDRVSGTYRTQQLAEYDLDAQLPPSFIDIHDGQQRMGQEQRLHEYLSGWDSRLHDGMAKLAGEAERLALVRGSRVPGRHARPVGAPVPAPIPRSATPGPAHTPPHPMLGLVGAQPGPMALPSPTALPPVAPGPQSSPWGT